MTSVHNTTQNSSDNLPSCLQTTVIAQRRRGTPRGLLVIVASTMKVFVNVTDIDAQIYKRLLYIMMLSWYVVSEREWRRT